jgi:hypothetical protein
MGTIMRGDSYANGETASGPRSPRRWGNGWQAPEPVTIYTLAESDRYT